MIANTNSLSLANFVGIVVCFFDVCNIRLRRLLLAASLSFESKMVLVLSGEKTQQYSALNYHRRINYIMVMAIRS